MVRLTWGAALVALLSLVPLAAVQAQPGDLDPPMTYFAKDLSFEFNEPEQRPVYKNGYAGATMSVKKVIWAEAHPDTNIKYGDVRPFLVKNYKGEPVGAHIIGLTEFAGVYTPERAGHYYAGGRYQSAGFQLYDNVAQNALVPGYYKLIWRASNVFGEGMQKEAEVYWAGTGLAAYRVRIYYNGQPYQGAGQIRLHQRGANGWWWPVGDVEQIVNGRALCADGWYGAGALQLLGLPGMPGDGAPINLPDNGRARSFVPSVNEYYSVYLTDNAGPVVYPPYSGPNAEPTPAPSPGPNASPSPGPGGDPHDDSWYEALARNLFVPKDSTLQGWRDFAGEIMNWGPMGIAKQADAAWKTAANTSALPDVWEAPGMPGLRLDWRKTADGGSPLGDLRATIRQVIGWFVFAAFFVALFRWLKPKFAN